MSAPVRRRRQAQEELLRYVDSIADENPDAAIRLIDAFESACAHLSNYPEMAPLYETDDSRLAGLGLRKWVLPEFPSYLVFYRFDAGVVDVLHVFHAKLDYERRLP